jgi:purine-nucleoside phosphorylase
MSEDRMDHLTIEAIDAAADALRRRTTVKPRVGLILGSGLGTLADKVEGEVSVPSSEVPGWPISTVEGHAGRIVFGRLEGQPVLIQQGRAHYYEGHSMARLGLPVRVMQRLGVEILIVTNAAGAIDRSFEPGDLMLIRDHVNLMGMAGLSPLRGPNLDDLGPRFPDMSQAYDPELRALARTAASAEGIPLHEGVYVCLGGPTFESPADLRFLRGIGADAVGMSTVPEVIVARHGATRVLGISGISNKANLDGTTATTHEEVLAAGRLIVPRLTAVLRGVLRRL